jgi:hypothetical protein
MRTLGCLTVIVLIVVGIFLWTSTKDMTGQQKAQWVGQKAHRGWNQAQKFLQGAKQGWQDADPAKKGATPTPPR